MPLPIGTCLVPHSFWWRCEELPPDGGLWLLAEDIGSRPEDGPAAGGGDALTESLPIFTAATSSFKEHTTIKPNSPQRHLNVGVQAFGSQFGRSGRIGAIQATIDGKRFQKQSANFVMPFN